jgi:hypothetical protein
MQFNFLYFRDELMSYGQLLYLEKPEYELFIISLFGL